MGFWITTKPGVLLKLPGDLALGRQVRPARDLPIVRQHLLFRGALGPVGPRSSRTCGSRGKMGSRSIRRSPFMLGWREVRRDISSSVISFV